MTPNKSKSGFYVDVTCPGCGAGLTIDSDFFVITCQYCESVLRLKMPDITPAWLIPSRVQLREVRFAVDRYQKENGGRLTDTNMQFKRIYYPYWKVDALLLKVRNKTIERLVQVASEDGPEVVSSTDKTEIGVSAYSVTVAGDTSLGAVPDSLGIRSQTITARPFTREIHEDDFAVVEPSRDFNDVWAQVVMAVMNIGDFDTPSFGSNLTEMLYPEFSLLYFPYFLVDSYAGADYLRFVVDGISSRVVACYDPLSSDSEESDPDYTRTSKTKNSIKVSFAKGLGGDFQLKTGKANNIRLSDGVFESATGSNIAFGGLTVELHRCDTCGIDLPDTRSPLYICPNCHELKAVGKIDFPLEEAMICRTEHDVHEQILPFWRLRLDPDQVQKLRFVFGGMYTADSVVVPAFSSQNLDAYLRLARKMSFAQQRLQFEPFEGSPKQMGVIEVSPEAAVKFLNLLIYRERLGKSNSAAAKGEEFCPISGGILYAPFKLQNYFYVDSVLESITFEKQLLA